MYRKLTVYIIFVVLSSVFLNAYSVLAIGVGDACVSDTNCKISDPRYPNGLQCIDGKCAEQTSSKSSDTAKTTATVPSQFTGFDNLQGIDQRCWTREACRMYRQETYGSDAIEAEKGFYSAKQHGDAEVACGVENADKQELGFCLAAGQSETNISFGGQKNFANIAEFIKFIYRYGFVIGSIVAVVFIMIAGVQWLFSGGNTDMITKAKSRIGGSVIGLILLALSYNILNLINPYLVELRLPQIWLINTQGDVEPSCSLLTDATTTKTALAFADLTQVTREQRIDLYKKAKFNDANIAEKAECGNNYFVQNGGGQTCRGDYCDPNKYGSKPHVCYPKNAGTKRDCFPGNITGEINNDDLIDSVFVAAGGPAGIVDLFREGWDWKWGNQPYLYAVCNNGTYDTVDGGSNDPDTNFDETKKTQRYVVSLNPDSIKEEEQDCSDFGGLKGFVLSLDMNENSDIVDERHFIGVLRGVNPYIGIDLGDKSNPDADCVLRHAEEKYFLTKDEVSQGNITLNVNAKIIADIDEGDSERRGIYKYLNANECFH